MSTETIKISEPSEEQVRAIYLAWLNDPAAPNEYDLIRAAYKCGAKQSIALNAPPEAPAVEAVLSDEQIDKMVDRHYRTTRHPDSYTALRATIRDCIQAALAEKAAPPVDKQEAQAKQRDASAGELPMHTALRLLAQQIKESNGLRDNMMRHHTLLFRAADAIAKENGND